MYSDYVPTIAISLVAFIFVSLVIIIPLINYLKPQDGNDFKYLNDNDLCFNICNSKNETYIGIKYHGYGNVVCYCNTTSGEINTYNM